MFKTYSPSFDNMRKDLKRRSSNKNSIVCCPDEIRVQNHLKPAKPDQNHCVLIVNLAHRVI